MKKLMMTVVAGSLCAAFGGAYAQGTPGPSGAQATPTSKTGVQTPKQVDDNRMAQGGKGGATTGAGASTTGSATTGGSSTAGSSTTGGGTAGSSSMGGSSSAGTSGASGSSSATTDTGGTSRSRRAARREKG